MAFCKPAGLSLRSGILQVDLKDIRVLDIMISGLIFVQKEEVEEAG